MWKKIINELKEHSPFTIFGALTGIILMMLFKSLPHKVSHNMFYIFHPAHVVLSALATASMYEMYKCGRMRQKCNIGMLLIIGYFGSVGIATLSDSIIPYFGETLLNMSHREAHVGFIEKWWLINPLAILGIAIAYFKPNTKLPHAGHVLISTWASLFHMMMAAGEAVNPSLYFSIFVFLFISVWLPCCVSDIIFPLLFVGHKEHK